MTPKEILRTKAQLLAETTPAIQNLPDNQPVTISPELVAKLKQLFNSAT